MSPWRWGRSKPDDSQDPGVRRDDEGARGGNGRSVSPAPSSVIPANAGICDATVFAAAALVLSYPDEQLLDRLHMVEEALAGNPAAAGFTPVVAHLRGGVLRDVQAFHVQEFDLSRRHSLHLSYWTDGDTRRRGAVLAEVKQTYRDSGLLVDTGGELPDYLPMVLEFAAADPARGVVLLQRFRASLELIRLELLADDLPHAGVLVAVCDRLPGPSPRTRSEIQTQYGPSPSADPSAHNVEFVGLDLVATTGKGAAR